MARKWTIQDRNGREIYMTEERWLHILSKHHELIGHLDDVLETVRRGNRRQDHRDPQRYRYRRECLTLSNGNNLITVVVLFSFQEQIDGASVANNFVTTAWGESV